MRVLVRFSACATVFSTGTLLAHIGAFRELETLDLSPLEGLVSQVSVFVPFLLALFVSLSLSRWWALRVTALGQVFDSLANTCMIVASELNDLRWEEVRLGVMKYGM